MNLTGQCGIIFVSLIDPLSQIISKITGSKDINAVGFYYMDAMSKQYRVILYNTYNNSPVSWMKLGCSKDVLSDSPFITKIVYYPYASNDIDFRASVIKTITENKVSDNYSLLLLKCARLLEEKDENFDTGYTLVNTVLEQKDILLCSLPPVTITSIPIKPSDEDIEYIVKQSRKEITNLFATFIDLFTTNRSFNLNVLRLNIFNPKLLSLEDQLLSYLTTGFENGIISSYSVNVIIKNLNEERFGHGKLLPLIVGPKDVHITDDDIPCTFQFEPSQINVDPLEDLGIYIKHIVNSLEDPAVTSINLNDIISCYNNLTQNTTLSKIDYPTKIISKEAIITTSNEDISISVNSKTVPLTMFNGNLSRLTDSQLTDILVYIDSLRDNRGSGDSKFSNLQNKIVHELALRHKKRY